MALLNSTEVIFKIRYHREARGGGKDVLRVTEAASEKGPELVWGVRFRLAMGREKIPV